MVEQSNKIFLTKENLAFSFPLIIICAVYSYFTFIPLQIGLPILGVAVVIYLVRAQFEKQRVEKLTNLDDTAIKELIEELDDNTAATKSSKDIDNAAAVRKAKNKVKQRLAQEKKAEAAAKAAAAAAAAAEAAANSESTKKSKKSKKKSTAADDDDDEFDYTTFAGKKNK